MASQIAGQAAGWLDVKVIYARISAQNIINSSSDYLVFSSPPREISSELEVNGARRSPLEDVSLSLRKDRADCESSEATFVSTDRLRIRRHLSFGIFHEGEKLVACSLNLRSRPSLEEAVSGLPVLPERGLPLEGQWTLECSCTTSSSWSGFAVKSVQELSDHAVQPSLEICIVGRCDGLPVMLTETVQLTARRKNHWKGGLDAIPEVEESDRMHTKTMGLDDDQRKSVVVFQGNQNSPKQQSQFPGFYDLPAGYVENEEGSGELSWFNAGVRVGVGLGLGMCIGVGIGVGLLIKTYQTTTRSFRRSLF
ncbi:hypothetical protein CLOM_g15312 [Closterium sp. NIES-68]|nr:hypothetical protein CLOM_g15312 [Closterium sp. NIES-68]GJP61387.1 hypothetical protein CLOP_g18555 [Closterium sp. NIES-67]